MLRVKGVKIALVDFGIGYSSMSNLSEIEFDYAIIPKKLINQITTSTKTGGMVRGFLELIKQLDAQAICEGVETAQQYDILKKYGYTLMSGTYFSNILNEDNLIRRHRGNF
jgi:EAL domain-containing protein (putative c-di-GMP-specific phosphodiesterase class I)